MKKLFHRAKRKVTHDQATGAQKSLMEQLFNDYYANRGKVYKMNFVRGLMFGFGSVLGGTVVLALVVWLLSLFVSFPLIGEYFQQTQDVLEQGQR